MSEKARELLEAFDALPEKEQHRVLRDILQRTASDERGPLNDAALPAAADEALVELDG